ncbi:DNA mismatch repair endonuclease MutL [Sporosarcina sp. Marseille-Q4063]|uniref:DNA mismatch repair endonuclease MutL n=1 Tax=Sporosarcina sp. Marseille-Q4063 TaxID=2810514 RepID=UPI001BAF2F3E|nr:DNA mismatch repair endonuclease MutL [Sporosarcina sp. Marseille-Q4063]QUW21914.1 DNA mismatch repair endonuclease MutL [Sporosarcina sp. Marseille-Q4063]
MNIIKVMDDTLSNKIAAGEVVERPASIVKELVENSIDAESTVIEVALEEAGLTKIRVTDNGKGMSKQDAIRAFERHATSKIDNEHDLFRIRTLGFRGEALASIASVSKIELWTSDGESTGTEVFIDGGKLVKHDNAAYRKGTDITVSQLFFNTPARLKYMKTIQTELGHTIGLVNRLALSHPHIAFKLTHSSQSLLQTSGSGDQLRVLADIYGISAARKMVQFKGENADYSTYGYVSLPEMTRASRNYMTTIVNGRWIQSYAINRAVLEAFHTFLPIGRYPIAVINVEGDPFLTDVNVHPSKQQIRMSKEGELLTLIKESIQKAIQKNVVVPGVTKKESAPQKPSEQVRFWATPPRQEPPAEISSTPVQQPDNEPSPVYEKAEQSVQQSDWAVNEPSPTAEVTEIDDGPTFPTLFPVGQVHGTYIIAQNEDGFFMIDQHAAQERIKYEYFRDKLKETEINERQLLLVPLTFHYSVDEKTRIEEGRKLLEDVGIYLEEFGQTSYIVREFPTWFPAGEETEIIEEIIEQVLNSRRIDIGKLREEAAIMMSCKRSIKANHHLTMADMGKLLNDLSEAGNPFTCPHGRPVLIHFTTYEIEKMFKRVM